ncbi:MAG: 16S rRNA (guanine(527)-N(7))-methyltransferase RsmG [Bacilli bacterium]|nr:16S rRNA (guanine(527)-N(7))-methyltransferase RsmG [Bacilli bacterium]
MNKECLQKTLSLSDSKINLLESFMDDVLLANEKFNLTAITDKEDFREKMIYDSAIILNDFDFTNRKIIDIGTGAGFPGMVIRMLVDNVDISLLDSTSKKINFLKEIGAKYDLNCKFYISRAEELSRNNREVFDVVTARAVSSLNTLLELSMPLLKVGGCLLAFKGPSVQAEINDCKEAFKKLNCEVEKCFNYTLPNSKEIRNILLIRKNDITNKKYPRDYAEILRKPL